MRGIYRGIVKLPIWRIPQMLTDTAIRNAKPKKKAYKLFDGDGLYLMVSPTGFMSWRYKYRFNDKERLLTIGKYRKAGSKSAGFSLQEARKEHAIAYALIQQGIDPAQKKKAEKEKQRAKKEAEQPPQGKTFREVANLWADYRALPDTTRSWKFEHKLAVLRSLEKYVFPVIGGRVIQTLSSDDIHSVIDPIQERGTLEVLGRTLNRIDSIFRYAKHKKFCEDNPAHGLSEYTPTRKTKHMNYVNEKQLPSFLHDLENYHGNIVCKLAVEFILLTHVRTKELRFAEWTDFDLESNQWIIPAKKMKKGIGQIVPLSDQALNILETLKPITSSSKYVFASLMAMSKPISENGMLSVVYNMGWKGKTTVHGLRSTYSTIANETLKMRPDVIEASLAHKVKDPVRRAYNRATYLTERTENIQIWADYLDKVRKGADIIKIKKTA